MVYDLAHGFLNVPLPSAAILRATVLPADMVVPSPCSSQLRASCELRLQIKFVRGLRKKARCRGEGFSVCR